MSTEPIRVGIVGLGRSGWDIHVRAIRSMPETYRVVAVTDLLTERAASCAAELGVRQHDNFESLIADPEVELVVVASYNLHHADQAEAALRAGKHVICEKPFGLTTSDVDRITAAAAASG